MTEIQRGSESAHISSNATSSASTTQKSSSATPTHTPSVDTSTWSPSSYRGYPIKQQPEYKDADALEQALRKVRQLPPLVHHDEVVSLKQKLALAAEGKAFLLQGGDCAERFMDCSQQPIENKFKILLQMSLIILHKARVPIVRIARMAGQFAKPRSSTYETVNGQQVLSFKGDNINSFDVSKREPDPNRMVEAYFHSAATLNYIRAMISGGVADLHHPDSWILDHIQDDSVRDEYEKLINKITDAMDFFHIINADRTGSLKSVELFTSHEGLLLGYEEALTKRVKNSHGDKYFNLGAHFLWIGDRTRDINGAHVEYFKGIANPVGVKVGPSMKPDELVELISILNPDREPGKLTLITRYGSSQVEKLLPGHIQAVKKSGVPVLWVCDPCHGNTEMTSSGYKTRDIEKMLSELIKTFEVHKREGTILGGVHLELTGDNVTECVGGSQSLSVSHLPTNYETFCDPRLNYTQSLDFAFAVAGLLSNRHKQPPANHSS